MYFNLARIRTRDLSWSWWASVHNPMDHHFFFFFLYVLVILLVCLSNPHILIFLSLSLSLSLTISRYKVLLYFSLPQTQTVSFSQDFFACYAPIERTTSTTDAGWATPPPFSQTIINVFNCKSKSTSSSLLSMARFSHYSLLLFFLHFPLKNYIHWMGLSARIPTNRHIVQSTLDFFCWLSHLKDVFLLPHIP